MGKKGNKTEKRIPNYFLKRCYLMLSEANNLTSENQNAKICYAIVSCRLKTSWNDNQHNFFDTFEDLRDLLDRSW